MERHAIPFQLRDFMVKCWTRHRDVPTKINEVVDRAVEDLQRRQQALKIRMTKNKIKVESLQKVEELLDCCFDVVAKLHDEGDVAIRNLKNKVESIKKRNETSDTQYSDTQLRFRQLSKKGNLGKAGKINWQWATKDIPTTIDVPGSFNQCVTTNINDPPLQETLNDDCSTSDSSVPFLSHGDNRIAELAEITDEWVECVQCSKWRRLPLGMKADTLLLDWTCSSGAAWRTGLNCDEAEDAEIDVSHYYTFIHSRN
jgi:hypothetical protein